MIDCCRKSGEEVPALMFPGGAVTTFTWCLLVSGKETGTEPFTESLELDTTQLSYRGLTVTWRSGLTNLTLDRTVANKGISMDPGMTWSQSWQARDLVQEIVTDERTGDGQKLICDESGSGPQRAQQTDRK